MQREGFHGCKEKGLYRKGVAKRRGCKKKAEGVAKRRGCKKKAKGVAKRRGGGGYGANRWDCE